MAKRGRRAGTKNRIKTARGIQATALGDAVRQELTLYSSDVVARVDYFAHQAAVQLVKLTKATAPVGKRGQYRKNISQKVLVKTKTGVTYVWYVKGSDARLTHLLAHGHATRDGGRTKADPYLQNAMDQVLPEYERKVKEAIERG